MTSQLETQTSRGREVLGPAVCADLANRGVKGVLVVCLGSGPRGRSWLAGSGTAMVLIDDIDRTACDQRVLREQALLRR